uniref:Uncharacterized protein n=1 Tax=Neogobius melanostomus TaxID=47308 RepID=A0A8C6SED9_9GOBI
MRAALTRNALGLANKSQRLLKSIECTSQCKLYSQRHAVSLANVKKKNSHTSKSILLLFVCLARLLSSIKPGLVKKINRLPTPIAGQDNLSVLITIYWLGRAANCCTSYNGPTLDLAEFEGLLSQMRKVCSLSFHGHTEEHITLP